MLQKAICWWKSKMGECRYYSIAKKDYDIKIAKLCLNNISMLQSKLDNCIKGNKIEDVLRFRGDFLNKYYWDEVQENELSRKINNGEEPFLERKKCSCKQKAGECKSIVDKINSDFDTLMTEIDEKIKKYNNDLSILKKVQYYCLKESEARVYRNNDVYLKFGRDKYNSLIALYFDIKSFTESDNWQPTETIYLFSGDGEYPYDKHSFLQLRYEDYYPFSIEGTNTYEETEIDKWAEVHICNFVSNNQKRGHGTFILQNLEDIIRQVNKRIIINQKKGRYPIKVITAITGNVRPQGIPFDTLVKFYNKNGFPTFGINEKGVYYKDSIIYKELIEFKNRNIYANIN